MVQRIEEILGNTITEYTPNAIKFQGLSLATLEEVVKDDHTTTSASFRPDNKQIIYESMVNLRPRQNRSMEIQDAKIRKQVAAIIMEFLA